MGRNPSIADPVEWAALKAAKKRGARIIVVDPKRTPVAQMADLWLAPRIGRDAALALAMTHVLISEGLYDQAFTARWCHGFDELAKRAAGFAPAVAEGYTGVPAEQIAAAARMYADGPSTFVSGHGIDAFSAGVQTFRAYHCLVAISGNIDRPGGNLRMRTPRGLRTYGELLHRPEFRLNEATEKRTIGADRFPLWAGPRGWQTACHNPSAIDAMLTGRPYPVRALYASGVNIVVTYPDTRRTIEALRSLDFVVVAGHAMTPTAEHADIVLPKTTTLEEEEVSFMPSGPTVLFTRAVVPPQGEARSEIDIAVPLLAKMAERQAIARHLLPWRSQRVMPRRPMWSIPAWAGGCRAIPRRSMVPSTSISMPRSATMDPTIRYRGRAIFGGWRAECEPFLDRDGLDSYILATRHGRCAPGACRPFPSHAASPR